MTSPEDFDLTEEQQMRLFISIAGAAVQKAKMEGVKKISSDYLTWTEDTGFKPIHLNLKTGRMAALVPMVDGEPVDDNEYPVVPKEFMHWYGPSN